MNDTTLREQCTYLRRREAPKRNDLLDNGKFALGVFSGICLLITLYVGAGLLQVEMSRDEVVDLLPSVAAILISGASLTIAFNALSEQRRMRQAGTDPVVIAHLAQRDDAPSLAMIRLTNVGAGAALDVIANFSWERDDFDESRVITDPRHIRGPFRAVLQDCFVQFTLGIGHKILGENPLPPIRVALEYKNVDGTTYSSTQIIDVTELDNQDATPPSIATVATELAKLSSAAIKVASTDRYQNVVVETRAQHQARQEKEYRELVRRME